MTGKKKITPRTILLKLGQHWDWKQFTPQGYLCITYEKFEKIMAFDESYEPILNRRYCREYFAMFVNQGFLERINQYEAYRWNIELVQQQIGLLPNPNDSRGYDYDSSSPECLPTTNKTEMSKGEVSSQ